MGLNSSVGDSSVGNSSVGDSSVGLNSSVGDSSVGDSSGIVVLMAEETTRVQRVGKLNEKRV